MLLVDAANVVGSRPNGWWRDRGKAAHDLCTDVDAAIEAGQLEPEVVGPRWLLDRMADSAPSDQR